MAQHDYLIDNGSGAVVRSDINNVLDAVATNNSGTTEPAVTHSFQWWADTTSDLLKQRNEANQLPVHAADEGRAALHGALCDRRFRLGVLLAVVLNSGSTRWW